jgi:hypothetical protein
VYVLGTGINPGAIRFFFNAATGEYVTYDTSAAALSVGVWQHVVVTMQFGVNSGAKIFVNGVEQAGSWTGNVPSQNAAPAVGNEQLWLGAYDGNPAGIDDPLQAQLDEVSLWGRIISGPEALSIYNLQKP